MTPRDRMLWGGLAATLGIAGWLALQPDEPAPPAVAAASRPARAAEPSASQSGAAPLPSTPPAPQRSAWPELGADARAAWGPPPASPPPPPPVEAAPAAPSPPPPPPPFPYQVIGRYDDGEHAQALLSGPLRSLGVREGDVLDGQWRVERVAAEQLSLLWLPGRQPVVVPVR